MLLPVQQLLPSRIFSPYCCFPGGYCQSFEPSSSLFLALLLLSSLLFLQQLCKSLCADRVGLQGIAFDWRQAFKPQICWRSYFRCHMAMWVVLSCLNSAQRSKLNVVPAL